MEKEFKVAELAAIWQVSVTTANARIRKMGLETFKKRDETNKEITYVRLSDSELNNPVYNVNNKVNNNVNNIVYEDLLTVNNDNKPVNNPENTLMVGLSAAEVFERLTDINNQYNERLEAVNKELIDAKSKQLLLEDKANREGYYINEINTLKRDYKGLTTVNEIQKYIIAGLVILLVGLATYLITVNNSISDQIIDNKKTAEVQEVVETPTPQQVNNAIMNKKK